MGIKETPLNRNCTEEASMHELNHWHPVLSSRKLGRKPVAVRLCGMDIVLFRTADGQPGALEDRCAHRRMRLSAGRVEDRCLVCPYHGWSYQRDGQGKSASTPRLEVSVRHFDVVERHEAIWVKAAGAAARFPEIGREGYHQMCTYQTRIAAPLELVLDNIVDREHTGGIHLLVGFDPKRMEEVEVKIEATDDMIKTTYTGPFRKGLVTRTLARLNGIRDGAKAVYELTNYFSPVYQIDVSRWLDPATGQMYPLDFYTYIFMVPVDANTTDCMFFMYSSRSNPLLKPLSLATIALEFHQDKKALHKINAGIELAGMRLGRLDKVLGKARHYLQRIYRDGQSSARGGEAPAQHEPKLKATL
jgi:vanillate O-demethylase monooxygenase subunit